MGFCMPAVICGQIELTFVLCSDWLALPYWLLTTGEPIKLMVGLIESNNLKFSKFKCILTYSGNVSYIMFLFVFTLISDWYPFSSL